MIEILSEFEIQVCRVFAKYHTYSLADIKFCYCHLGSFDDVQLAIRSAARLGVGLKILTKKLLDFNGELNSHRKVLRRKIR